MKEVDQSLRSFLMEAAQALGGLTAVVTVGMATFSANAKSLETTPVDALLSSKSLEDTTPKKRMGMVIDLRRCTGCRACTVACKSENEVPLGYFRTWVKLTEVSDTNQSERLRRQFLPIFCNHCENPTCVQACEPKALQKRADGLVFIDKSICDGCGTCITSCPYQALYLHPQTGLADKCNLCKHRTDENLPTACEQTCVGGAIYVGDLNDPESRPSKHLKSVPADVPVKQLKPETGNGPNIYYIDPENRTGQANVGGVQRLEYVHPEQFVKPDPNDPRGRKKVTPKTKHSNNKRRLSS
ncbi:MAG: 4Fe-4S dicluster domain-containing protein [Acidobacteriota bacterium]